MSAIDKLKVLWEKTTREQKWVHGKTPRMSFEQMRKEYAGTLKKTLDYFLGETLNQVHGVYFENNETLVAITGISPNSPANAAFIAAVHNAFPQIVAEVEVLQTERDALKESQERLIHLHEVALGLTELDCLDEITEENAEEYSEIKLYERWCKKYRPEEP